MWCRRAIMPPLPACCLMAMPTSMTRSLRRFASPPSRTCSRLTGWMPLPSLHSRSSTAGLRTGSRAADGEEWAAAIAAVLRAYQGQVAALPPLSRVLPRLVRPDERAAQAFTQICSLLALQNAQLDELKATIAELI